MNNFDQEKLGRLMAKLSPYEKVLLEKARREELKRERIERQFDWFVRGALGEFYNYDPRHD